MVLEVLKRSPKLKIAVLGTFGKIITIYMFFINKIFGIKRNRVVFTSFGGSSYGGNPKAISEKLHTIDSTIEIIWLFKNVNKERKLPPYLRVVNARSVRAYWYLSTSKIWIDDCCKPIFTYKSSEQIYIQTWHGDRGFKKVVLDSPFLPKNFKIIEDKACDLMLSGSEYGNRKFKSAFNYSGEIFSNGTPRNDELINFNKTKIKELKEAIKIKQDTKILLYAPTYRRNTIKDNDLQTSFGLNLKNVLQALNEKTGDNWVCFVRAHNSVRGIGGISIDNENIFDMSSYEDMTDLLLISDFLITDYSSSAGDFALLNKPIVLYQPDREEYLKKSNSLYFEISKSPYITVTNQNSLIKIIKELNKDQIESNCKDILDFYGTIESGQASSIVSEYITSIIYNV